MARANTLSAPGLRSLSGEDKSYTDPAGGLADRAGGLTHCIVVTMPDRGSLPRYLEHPAHVPIAEALVNDIAELRVIDLDLD